MIIGPATVQPSACQVGGDDREKDEKDEKCAEATGSVGGPDLRSFSCFSGALLVFFVLTVFLRGKPLESSCQNSSKFFLDGHCLGWNCWDHQELERRGEAQEGR